MCLVLLILFFILPKPCFANIPTATPLINPVSGIYLSEYMPDSSETEWVEIFNNNDFSVILDGWKIKDDPTNTNTPKNIDYVNISAKSFYTQEIGTRYLNNGGDYVVLINNTGTTVESTQYSDSSPTYSWSKQPDNTWCQSLPTKNTANKSCYSQATPPMSATDTPTPTPASSPVLDISIIDAPHEVEKGKKFSIKFTLKNGTPDTEYTFKAFDCRGDRTCFVKTVNGDQTLYSNSDWNLFPKYTTNIEGKIEDSIIMAIIDDCSEKTLQLGDYAQIRLKTKVGDTTPFVQGINIIFPTPTLTPSPTHAPTSPPTNTPTTTPTITVSTTPTPSNLTPSPTPSLSLTPADSLSVTPTNRSQPQILGVDTTDPPPQPKNPRQVLPIILMVVGGLFLTTPTIISKFKKP